MLCVRRKPAPTLALISFFFILAGSADECAVDTGGGVCQPEPECTLYLAPSSIPNAGYGIYTAIPVEAGDEVGRPDVCHAAVNLHSSQINNYCWEGSSQETEREGEEVSNLIPGPGMSCNGHYALDNVELVLPESSDAGLHRSASPAAGSFTRFHNLGTVATKPIPAGSELFLNYGVEYFRGRPEYKGKVFESGEFAFADRLVANLAALAGKHEKELDGATEAEVSTVMDLVRDIVASDIPGQRNSNIVSLVPETLEEVKEIAEMGVARSQFPKSVQPIDWLQDNGWCIDKIRPGISLRPELGRGALAARPIAAGEVIVASPMLYLFKQQLDYIREDDAGNIVLRKQQILNYCFGHPHSSIVLFPMGHLSNLINHGGINSNVSLRWASDDKQPTWWTDSNERREMVSNDAERFGGSGIILEYVSSRAISKDEEILLDYGSVWEEAWDTHVKTWHPPEGAERYIEASRYDEEGRHLIIRTVEEQVDQPYPSNIQTACYVDYMKSYVDHEDVGDDERSDELVDIEVEWVDYTSEDVQLTDYDLRPCAILRRENVTDDDDSDVYVAQIFNTPTEPLESRVEEYEKLIYNGLPRVAIRFIDKLYSTDQHLNGAFRMPMGMSVFPNEWKGLED